MASYNSGYGSILQGWGWQQNDVRLVEESRRLRGVEKFLGRKIPGTNKVCLPYAAAYILDGSVAHESLLAAVEISLGRHPMLKAYGNKDVASGKEFWFSSATPNADLAMGIVSTNETHDDEFKSAWMVALEDSLNCGEFPEQGPLWWMKNIQTSSRTKSCWILCFNHGLLDQKSTNLLVAELMASIHLSASMQNSHLSKSDNSENKEGDTTHHNKIEPATKKTLPPAVEAVVAKNTGLFAILQWMIPQFLEQPLKECSSIPLQITKNYADDPVKYAHNANPQSRRAIIRTFRLSQAETEGLLQRSRDNSVTVTSALSAAVLAVTSLFLQSGTNILENSQSGIISSGHLTEDMSLEKDDLQTQNLRFLVVVDTRPLAPSDKKVVKAKSLERVTPACDVLHTATTSDWTGGQVALASHGVHVTTCVPHDTVRYARDICANKIKTETPGKPSATQSIGSKNRDSELWDLAKVCRSKLRKKVENKFNEQMLFFEFLVNHLELASVVDKKAVDPVILGRDCHTGVSNVGVCTFSRGAGGGGELIELETLTVREVYFSVGYAYAGPYCMLSSITVDGCLCVTMAFTTPVTTSEEADLFTYCLSTLIKGMSI